MASSAGVAALSACFSSLDRLRRAYSSASVRSPRIVSRRAIPSGVADRWMTRASSGSAVLVDQAGRLELPHDARQHGRVEALFSSEFRKSDRPGAPDRHQHFAVAGGQVLLGLRESKAPIEPSEHDAKVFGEVPFLLGRFSRGVGHDTSIHVVACQQASTFALVCLLSPCSTVGTTKGA